METIIKINSDSQVAKHLISFLKTLPFVKVEENKSTKEQSEFVKKIKKARSEKGGKLVTADNLWESIK